MIRRMVPIGISYFWRDQSINLKIRRIHIFLHINFMLIKILILSNKYIINGSLYPLFLVIASSTFVCCKLRMHLCPCLNLVEFALFVHNGIQIYEILVHYFVDWLILRFFIEITSNDYWYVCIFIFEIVN